MTGERSGIVPTKPASRGRGCLLRVLVAALVLAATIGGGSYLAYRYAIARVTGAAPLDLGPSTLSTGEVARLDGRIAAFVHALRNKTPVAPLVLDAEELTALVARSPELRRLGARERLSIDKGRVRAEFSVPLDRTGHPGRWLNGEAAFAITLRNGALIVALRSASIEGKAVPGWLVRLVGHRNLAEELDERPLVGALIARLESVEVGDGTVTLVPQIRR